MPAEILAGLGLQAARGAVDGGMGLLLGNLQDKRQLKQQGRLTEQQLGFDKQKMDYQQGLALKMWEATNYSAQKEQLKKAGLNPALLYGMSGGGGTTIGNAGGGVSAPSAPQGGGEILGLMQLRSQEAQIKLMEAQAEKAKAEAEKTSGADTVEANSRTALNTINAAVADIEREIKGKTASSVETMISNGVLEQSNRLQEMVRNNSIGDKLYETTIKQAQAELIQTGLQNNLIQADTKLTYKRIWEISEKVAQGWKGLSIDEQNMMINRINAATNTVNANTNRMNAETGSYSAENTHSMQQFEKLMNDLKASDKEIIDVIKGVLQAGVIKGAAKR